MQSKPAELKVVTFDGQKLLVEELSPDAQRLVEYYNSYRHQEYDLDLELLKVKFALEGLSNALHAQIEKDLMPNEPQMPELSPEDTSAEVVVPDEVPSED